MFETIRDYADWIAVVSAGIAIIVVGWRHFSERVSRFLAKIDQTHGALHGRPPVYHPETGEVVVEGAPAMGARFALIEQAIFNLSQSHEEITELNRRVTAVMESQATYMEAHNAEIRLVWVAIKELREDVSGIPGGNEQGQSRLF